MTLVRALCLVVVLAPLVARAQPAPTVDGTWYGTLGGPGGLHLVLTITRAADGSQRGVIDSVDQGAKLPVEAISTSNDKVKLEVNGVGGVYEGKLERDGKHLRGTWTQRGVPAQPLDFGREPPAPGSAAAKPGPTKPNPLGPPIDVRVARAPIVASARGERVLVYELQITNFGAGDVTLASVAALDPAGKALWSGGGLELAARLKHVGRRDDAGEGQLVLPPGTQHVVFMWVTTPGAPPRRLTHRLEVREGEVTRAIVCAPSEVVAGKPLRLGPPLRGGPWMAANGPSAKSGHRRSLLPIDGHASIAQRFAIDWVRVDADGKTFSGDANDNAHYFAFGAEALAVAPGTIVEIKDGLAENPPGGRAVPIDLDTIAGNHVLLDLGGGRSALYAHLQPGSLRVKKGDRVRRGQVLGLVGNTGNSTEPHLHFHVAEGASPLGAEGVPYTLDAFDVRKTAKDPREHRKNEIPLEDDLVDFPVAH